MSTCASASHFSVEEYTTKVDVERRNIDQLTKQVEVMQAKLVEKVRGRSSFVCHCSPPANAL